jgi:hypothetical protein
MKKNQKLNNENVKLIIKNYLFGFSSIHIAKQYNVSPQIIRYILKKNNVKIRSSVKRTYSLNEYYFDKIDTIDKAYFLGLLFADGCNTGKGLKITLTEDDKEILEKFIKSINYGGNIKITQTEGGYESLKKTAILQICSKKISEDLIKHGCVKNKTHLLKFPKIDVIYFNHFIRGFFDGDGGININKKNQGRIYFTGNKDLICEINRIISEECKFNLVKLIPCKKCNGEIVDLFYSGNRKCEKIKNFIYNNNFGFYLKRKKIVLDKVKPIRNFKSK